MPSLAIVSASFATHAFMLLRWAVWHTEALATWTETAERLTKFFNMKSGRMARCIAEVPMKSSPEFRNWKAFGGPQVTPTCVSRLLP